MASLLRADMHTLFDIGLISIDSNFTIHVAPSGRDRPYLRFHKERVRQLHKPSQSPDTAALTERHNAFVKNHSEGIADKKAKSEFTRFRRSPSG